jgi:uncharacterized protein (DUF1800 family)
VAHLHRRAGFQAPGRVLDRDVAEGPEAAIERLLVGEPTSLDGRPAAEFERSMDALAAESAATGALGRLQAAWIYRMILSPHPLRERVTRFWHGHFATSNAKVNNLKLMNRQIALFRSHGLGDFRQLLAEVGRDPAMLLFLDSATNRKAHPNENYAREVMELFSLGRGRYSEKDVQEAARAFTGRFVQGDRFRDVAAQHDREVKRVLGVEGVLSGDSVVGILVDQPACAEFLARKLYRAFLDDVQEPEPALLEPLATTLRSSHYDMTATLKFLLHSRIFHDQPGAGRRVRGPVELAVGTVRALEIVDPTASPEALAEACTRMGESLFAPPNVAGWPGGAAWINTASSIERANLMLGLLSPSDDRLGHRFDPASLARRYNATDPAQARAYFVELLVEGPLQEGLRLAIERQQPPAGASDPERIGFDLKLVLTSPEYQLT